MTRKDPPTPTDPADPEPNDTKEVEAIAEVPDAGPMAQMPPEVAKMIAEALAKAVVEKKTDNVPTIDFEALPLDIMGMVPKFDRFYWYRGWKRDPTNPKRIVYDIYACNQKVSKILAKSLEAIDTKWGTEKTKAYFLWSVTRARSYDPTNKRVVPVRQIVMTPLMARRGADVAKLLSILTPAVIKKSVELIHRHEELVWADVAKMRAEEAETAWAIVDKKSESHFRSTERMLKVAGEAEDKGDQEFAKSFTENKDWKEKLADNWCLIVLGIVVLIYLAGYLAGWWGR